MVRGPQAIKGFEYTKRPGFFFVAQDEVHLHFGDEERRDYATESSILSAGTFPAGSQVLLVFALSFADLSRRPLPMGITKATQAQVFQLLQLAGCA